MSVVLDTNVVSYIYKKDTRAELYKPQLEGNVRIISFMTLAELNRWTLDRNWGEKRRNYFSEFLKDYLVVHSDESLCNIWAEIMNDAKRKGRPIETADAWVAATALMFGVPLVTHNHRHFENVGGLQIVSKN